MGAAAGGCAAWPHPLALLLCTQTMHCAAHLLPTPDANQQVRVLVEDIGRSVGELPPAAAAHPKLGRQLEYLGRLVRATVQAMAPAEPAMAAQ